jgi:hypothetical protein
VGSVASHPGDMAVGPNHHGSGSGDLSDSRKLPLANTLGVDQLNAICPSSDVEAARLTEVEEHRPGLVQQGEHPQRAVAGDQVEIRHAPSEQRVSVAEVVVNVQAGHLSGHSSPRLVHGEEP